VELLNIDRRTITVDFKIYWSQFGWKTWWKKNHL